MRDVGRNLSRQNVVLVGNRKQPVFLKKEKFYSLKRRAHWQIEAQRKFVQVQRIVYARHGH